jgi:prepilin-type N-terminal cleavage/methylation domain-containing protein
LSTRGFTLIELIVALVVGGVIGLALTRLIMSQTRFFNQTAAVREARSVSRSALNVLLSDLRMVEAVGGIEQAAAESVTVRIPYGFGVVCAATVAGITASMAPTDSATLAGASFAGFAWRNDATGAYTYVETAATVALGVSGTCTTAPVSIATIPGGRVALFAPGSTAPIVGTPIFQYQKIRYKFAPSTAVPGRVGLYRMVVSTGVSEELVTPFDATSRFRFYVLNRDTAQSAVPTLSQIRGFEVVLKGSSERVPSGRSTYQGFDLTTAIFFKNRQA